MSYRYDPPASGDRYRQLNIAAALMGDTAWKNSIGAPDHDHQLGPELGLTYTQDGRSTHTKLANCPRCGVTAAERYWPLALEEALHRMDDGATGPADLIEFPRPAA